MRLKKLVTGVLCAVLAVCCLPVASACQTPSDNSSGNSSTGGGNPPIEPVEIERAPLYSAVDLTGYTTYYFDSANGSDSNNGLSEASPKATLDAAETLAATATAALASPAKPNIPGASRILILVPFHSRLTREVEIE